MSEVKSDRTTPAPLWVSPESEATKIETLAFNAMENASVGAVQALHAELQMLNKQDAGVISGLNKQLAHDTTANKTLPWLTLHQEDGFTELVASHDKQDGPLPIKGGLLSATSDSSEILAINLKAYDNGGDYVGYGKNDPRSPSAEADYLLKLIRSGNDKDVQGELRSLIGEDPSYLGGVDYSLSQATKGGDNVADLTLQQTDGSLGAPLMLAYTTKTQIIKFGLSLSMPQ